ncbi:MAG: right-handed parallel beta-helix repeat-containing protein [Monoglobales bacterium]
MFNSSNLSTIYVSKEKGRDFYNGAMPKAGDRGMGPVPSMERALELVKEMRRIGALQPITIKITDEEYLADKPIVLSEDMFAITIEPYTKTLISGGVTVKNFKADEFNGVKCLSADLSEMGEIEFTDLYVNGKRADMPKYPQEGTLLPQAVENDSWDYSAHSKWFIAKREDMEVIKNFRNLGDCIISYNHLWHDEHSPIESFDVEEGKIVFKYPSRHSISPSWESAALKYVIENVAEEFKKPNHWYFDRPTKMLYYIPEVGVKTEDIKAYIPVTDKIFEIKGKPDNKARNINLRNLEIAYTKGDYGSRQTAKHKPAFADDETQYASDSQSVCAAHGSIEFEHASNCRIENCRLNCLGVHSIVIEEGSSNIIIRDNEITNSGAGAIRVNGGDYGSDENLHTCRNIISGNKIIKGGRRYTAGCGILLMHTYENIVSHNEISDFYYTGISCGWVWGYRESISRDNILEHNYIHTIGQYKLSDMGAIYILGKQPGTVIRNNLIHTVYSKTYGGYAIYTDEGASYITIENNICFDTGSSTYHQHYGCMNTVRNNVFFGSDKEIISASRKEAHTGLIFDGNVIISNGKPIYAIGLHNETESSIGDSSGFVNVIASHNNIIFDVEKDEPTVIKIDGKEYNLKEAQKLLGLEIGSTVFDTGFEKIKDGNMPQNSEAYALGFKRIQR